MRGPFQYFCLEHEMKYWLWPQDGLLILGNGELDDLGRWRVLIPWRRIGGHGDSRGAKTDIHASFMSHCSWELASSSNPISYHVFYNTAKDSSFRCWQRGNSVSVPAQQSSLNYCGLPLELRDRKERRLHHKFFDFWSESTLQTQCSSGLWRSGVSIFRPI